VIEPEYFGAIQANVFDGKSDGKNLSSILRPKFTVRKIPGDAKVYKYRHIRDSGSPGLGNP
jgi:hypothetical protein